ncbi:uncharacterized protein PFL1_00438 [Pseudozyma flocculosa PF-1]|uniref:Related to Benzoate 4-monooxygenase n=1 Tax=Pseudozyma flocculosa TaxID=84751 RepID=A0A5C3EUM3_9BASI|nr:uncharacterized protein PFL1_00438 [Pseudozyma flocculosa PF-1]EPQ32241.1 hypothetical protein PFL1_00438 [Pseudozyma flocculosa PF-1]SPO34809.1 related to Benzoate 4-monooxygenase [Pseudozyma flocculosa]
MAVEVSSPVSALAASLPWPLRVLLPLLVALVGYCAYSYFLHPLARYPGPLSARLGLPIWRFHHCWTRDYAFALHAEHKRHGPVVRIGPNHLSFSDPEAIACIYSASGGLSSKFVKTAFYRAFQVFKDSPSIFSERNPEVHAKRKRAIAPAYSIGALGQLEEYVELVADQLVDRIATDATPKGGPIKLDRYFSCLAMDVIGEIAFGESFGLLHGDINDAQRSHFFAGVLNLSQWGAIAGCLPWISHLILKAMPRITGEPGGWVIGAATKSRIDKRYEDERTGLSSARPDMLSKFMAAKHPDSRKQYSQREVLFTATSVIAAGADTTSTTLSIFFGYLAAHPECYAKLQAEVDAAWQDGTLTSPIKYKEAVELPYLQACLKEVLRLHPPISMDLPRCVPPGGAMIAGRFIPEGTTVGMSPYVVHHNPDAFGQDCDAFRPERWIDATDDEKKRMDRYNLTFGGGSRTCIGKNISLMEVSKIVPELVTRFSFKVPGYKALEKGKVPFERKSAWFLEAHDLVLEVTPRS